MRTAKPGGAVDVLPALDERISKSGMRITPDNHWRTHHALVGDLIAAAIAGELLHGVDQRQPGADIALLKCFHHLEFAAWVRAQHEPSRRLERHLERPEQFGEIHLADFFAANVLPRPIDHGHAAPD
jgi:hypothetical protein